MTPERRAEIITELEESVRVINLAAAGIPRGLQTLRLKPDSWSVPEVLEHLVLSEHGMFRRLRAAKLQETACVDTGREARIAAAAADRRGRREAPDGTNPSGRFGDISEALQSLGAARERTIRFVGEYETDFACLTLVHPMFGEVNGYEWLLIMAGHVRCHAAQIEEIKRLLPDTAPRG